MDFGDKKNIEVDKMLWDLGTRKIIMKIVYTGPAMSGKTTSVIKILEKFGKKEDLQSIETQSGRTLFFDFGTISIKKGNWNFLVQIWTATGQDFYAETRPTVLEGVDGIIFVADSQSHLMNDNLASWNELSLMFGNKWKDIPIIISLNKRDFPNTVPAHEFRELLGLDGSIELYETIATQGANVLEVFKSCIQKIFNQAS